MEIDFETWLGFKSMPKEEIEAQIVADTTYEDDSFNAGKKQYVLHVLSKLDKVSRYKIGLKSGNLTALVRAYGRDSKTWIGKSVKLKKGSNKGKDMLVVEPIL